MSKDYGKMLKSQLVNRLNELEGSVPVYSVLQATEYIMKYGDDPRSETRVIDNLIEWLSSDTDWLNDFISEKSRKELKDLINHI